MSNRKLKFKKYIPDDVRSILERQYSEYLRNNKLSKKEKPLLYEWICTGRSPYDNELGLYGTDGIPIDFITAMRIDNCPEKITTEWDPYIDDIIFKL